MTALLVPAIVKFGVIIPAAHMFAFYFAILSAITPPVALAVYAAAGLAKSDLWATGWAAVRIAATSFIVPFMIGLRAVASITPSRRASVGARESLIAHLRLVTSASAAS